MRKLQFNFGRMIRRKRNPMVEPRKRMPKARNSVIHVEGNLGEGNRFYIKGDDSVDGLSVSEGSKVPLEKLYIEGGKTSIDNAGELDAPDAEIN